MRAMICDRLDEQSRLHLHDLPAPALMAGCVRIAVKAAGLNFADTLMLSGRYQEKVAPPFAPGLEVAGVITEVADDVLTCVPGMRVLAVLSHGGYAEQVVAPVIDVLPIPEDMDFATAAGFPVAYGTSYHALTSKAALRRGEILLVHGAAGGVGLTAVEIGRAIGARVIATAGSSEKLAVALAHGASDGINSRDEDIRQRVRDLTGGHGADVVYDPVGGELFDASLRCTAMDGRLLVIGFASGQVPQIPANILLVKNLTVIGYYWGAYRQAQPQQWRDGLQELLRWFTARRITPEISARYRLEQANDALDLLRRRGSTGKIILEMD